MSRSARTFRASAVPGAALRRLRNAPSYFFLVWRWSMWLYALIVILFFRRDPPFYEDAHLPFTYVQMAALLLVITFIQTLVVTLYAPVFQVVLVRLFRRGQRKPTLTERRQNLTTTESPSILPTLTQARDARLNIAIYALDVIVCGLVVYYSGPFTHPPFGVGSPFYRYGMSTAIAAALVYRYKGALAAAIGFDLFVVLGMVFKAPGAPADFPPNVIDVVGSLIDAPVAGILAAYLISLLNRYADAKRQLQENSRHLRWLAHAPPMMKGTNDPQELLQRCVTQIRRWGHFNRLIIALSMPADDDDNGNGHEKDAVPEFRTCVESEDRFPDDQLSDDPEACIQRVLDSGQKLISFDLLSGDEHAGYGIARLYLPRKEGKIQIVIGAETRRQTPFGWAQEEFLRGASESLLIALDNLRLTARMEQLATITERGRIAREIHDGVAQLIYMLSLHAETCEAQARRIAEASEEDAELLDPLAARLNHLVTISKQALWETRNYMFSLKPMISGYTTLTQMLSNQVREFEAISSLPTTLHINGNEVLPNGNQRLARRQARIGTALFRIVQESLSNAYKHANASKIEVHLHFLTDKITVEILDNGQGLPIPHDSDDSKEQIHHLYFGHGLKGMRERAQELGGTLDVQSQPAGGVSVQVCIPL